MNKFVASVAVLALAAATTAFAGPGCCAAGKAKSDAKASADAKWGSCGAMLSKLDLTPEQKAKVEALAAQCEKEKCSDTAKANYAKGLEQILTAEQIARCKELCAKEGKGACLMAQTAKK
ncbi:MAG: hypothetical protein NZ483_04545 [Verrucomicrobiae bacterium]|nr:hypothetical protein [Verrucomicrobiae bacterium]MDW8345130.1 hypothetical protein [Verrucomicrobiae bacterium]